MTLNQLDVLAIHDVINLYGHVLDEQRWSDLDQVFTQDVIFDFSALGLDVLTGIDAVRRLMRGYTNPPRAHHATNIVVTLEDGEPRALSKGLILLANGVTASWIYRDRLRSVAGAWRIAHRIGTRLAEAGSPRSAPRRSGRGAVPDLDY
jgi:SnoaL-like domain